MLLLDNLCSYFNTQAMQLAGNQVSIYLKVATVVACCVLLLLLVQAMNRWGFEERFGGDPTREPEFGVSENEVEENQIQMMMMRSFGGGHHHHF